MKLNSLKELLEDQLKDIYSAEQQIVQALPKMIEVASSEKLSEALSEHLAETEGQVTRLETAAQSLGIKLAGKKCKGMEGLIAEAKECLEQDGADHVLDGAFIAAAQRIEHYEIAAYGTARAIAEVLGETDVVEALEESLDEERDADSTLTELAVAEVYELESSLEEGRSSEEGVEGSVRMNQNKRERTSPKETL